MTLFNSTPRKSVGVFVYFKTIRGLSFGFFIIIFILNIIIIFLCIIQFNIYNVYIIIILRIIYNVFIIHIINEILIEGLGNSRNF